MQRVNGKMMGMGGMAFALMLGAMAQHAEASVVVAQWTFANSQPTTAGTHSAELGWHNGVSSAHRFHANPGAAFSSPAGNGSSNAFSSTHWLTGDFYEFQICTLGFESLSIQWDQMRSSDGPSSFRLLWSLDGINFTSILAYTVTTSWTTFGSILLPPGLSDQDTIYLRLRNMSDAPNLTGANTIDNVVVVGMAIPVPGALPLLGLAGLFGYTRRRRN